MDSSLIMFFFYLPCIVYESELVSLHCVVAQQVLGGAALIVGMLETSLVELLQESFVSSLAGTETFFIQVGQHSLVRLYGTQ